MRRYTIDIDAPITEGLNRLNQLSGDIMTLFVLDAEQHLCGTLTDGDVRRALVNGTGLTAKVGDAMHRDFRAIAGNDIDVAKLREYRKQGIKLVPYLNEDGTIREIINLSHKHTRLPLSAILMAGGKGERLRPMTLDTPKPLLKIGDKAIIQYNIDALAACGISDIYVTMRYKALKIREYFANRTPKVKCIEEAMPLGTVGSAALAHLPDKGSSIVMNSDLLTNISFEDMYIHHITENAAITIAVIPYQVSVPFAILHQDPESGWVTGIEEKPSYSYFANAGIYIFPNRMLNELPLDRQTNATDLIEKAVAEGLKVTHFPINGVWMDIGTPSDFKQACSLMSYINGK